MRRVLIISKRAGSGVAPIVGAIVLAALGGGAYWILAREPKPAAEPIARDPLAGRWETADGAALLEFSRPGRMEMSLRFSTETTVPVKGIYERLGEGKYRACWGDVMTENAWEFKLESGAIVTDSMPMIMGPKWPKLGFLRFTRVK